MNTLRFFIVFLGTKKVKADKPSGEIKETTSAGSPEDIQALIPVNNEVIGQKQIQMINARELHEFLKVGKRFTTWIQDRIEHYEFIEDTDYVVFPETGRNLQGGRPAKEYHLSLSMAKELSMVERDEQGKKARQYFIKCEEKLIEQLRLQAFSPLARQAAEHESVIKVFQHWLFQLDYVIC